MIMNETEKLDYRVRIGEPEPLGTVEKGRKLVNIAIMVDGDEKCSLILYKKGTSKIATEIPFTEDMRHGNVFAMEIEGIPSNEFEYAFRIGNIIKQDPFAKIINGSEVWGETDKHITAGVYRGKYDWEDDKSPDISFEDSIIYRLHVRGFTKSKFSGVKHKGTFKGLAEKIPYIKSLGITMVELMPAYEFNEIFKGRRASSEPRVKHSEEQPKLNYWGYCEGNYFAPKAAYASSKVKGAAIREFKDMVKAFHKNGIEVAMEFYFPENINPYLIYQCFRFWVREYHIDGIHCNIPAGMRDMIQKDPYLSRTKLMNYGWNEEKLYVRKHLAEYNDVFMDIARCFLKGDEGRTADMAFRFRYNPVSAATINYMASNDTLTMMDMLSYSRSHNEANNEDNRDGRKVNNSWNCGFEGETKRRAVCTLRKKQIKNAFLMLLLSQGTPMIYAGDEFGHTCRGNNNPYCQDNEISWLNWNLVKKNKEILEFVKEVIQFRKAHPILHLPKQMQGRDYHALGIPDISYHSEKTWTLDTDVFNRHFGVMLFGNYSRLFGHNDDNTIFIAFNMHWEEQKIGIPKAGKRQKWKMVFNTSGNEEVEIKNRMLVVPPRTAVVMENSEIGKEENEKNNKK